MPSNQSWYKDFTRRLDAINSRVSEAPSNNVINPLAGVKASGDLSLGNPNPSMVDHLKDWGGNVLDVISRPGYAVGGVLNAMQENPDDSTSFDPVQEFLDGLTGKDKRFWQPSELLGPESKDANVFEKGGRFALDFLGAVATDPVSYIPGAAFVKAGKAIGKVTGLEKAVDSLKVKNAATAEFDPLKSAEVTNPHGDTPAFGLISDKAEPVFKQLSDKPWAIPPELLADVPASNRIQPNFVMQGKAPVDHGVIVPENKSPLAIGMGPRMESIGRVDPVPENFLGPQGASLPDNFEAMAKHAEEFTGNRRKPAGLSERDHLQVLSMVRDSITHSLRTIKGTFNASDIKSPWRSVVNEDLPIEPMMPKIERPVAPTGAGQPFEASVYAHAVKRAEAEASKHFKTEKEALSWARKNPDGQAFVPSTGKFYWDGQEQDINAWLRDAKWNDTADLTTPEGIAAYIKGNPGRGITVAPSYGESGGRMSLVQYINMFGEKGKVPRTQIPVNGKMSSLPKYVEGLKAKWEARASGATPEEMAAYQEALGQYNFVMDNYAADKRAFDRASKSYTPTLPVRPSRQELEDFLRTNKIVLSKEEKKRLLNASNLGEKAFLGHLSKLANETRRLNVESLDELEQMVKSGRVDKSVLDNILNKLGVKTVYKAKQKLEELDTHIARLQEKDTQRVAIEASKPVREPVSVDNFSSNTLGELPREVPEPRIPTKEVIQTKDVTPSVSQSEAAVDRATTPDIAASISPENKNRVFLAAKKAVAYEWDNWKKKYPHKTNRGAGRTDTAPGAGNAHWYGEFNAKKQYTFFKYALQNVRRTAEDAGFNINSTAGAVHKYDTVMPMLKAHDDLLRSYGIHPAAVPGGGYPISVYDVLSILPRKWVERHVFNTGSQVNIDQLLSIAQAAVDTKLIKPGLTEWGDELQHVATDLSGFAETVRGILGKEYKNAAGAKPQDYARKVGDKAAKRELDKTAKAHEFDAANPPSNYARDAKITGDSVADKTFSKGTLGPIVNEDFINAIQEKVRYNSARADIQYGKFVKKASQEQVNKFIEAVKSAETSNDVFKMVDGARKSVDSTLADTATIVPTRAAADEVKDSVELATANPATEIAAKQMAANHSATTALNSVKAEQEVTKSLEDFINAEHMTPTMDLSERAQLTMMGRMIHSVNPHIAEGDLRKILLNNNVAAGHITAQFGRQLSRFEQRVGRERANQLFHDLRLGHTPSAADAADSAEMRKIISRIFDDGENGGWSLAGNGIHPKHLNSNLKHFGVADDFKLPLSGSKEEIYGAWREMEPKDPMDLLHRYHAAVQKTIAEKNLGAQISNTFGSARYEPGLVKVTAKNGKSRIAHLINTDLYYPEEIARNMFALDNTLFELAKKGTDNKLLRLFDSATHAYKAGLTIYRPGHHMRNLYGDLWLGAMDGVYSPTYYKRATAVMSTRRNHYSDYNFDASLGDLTSGTAATVKIGRQTMHLSNDDVYRLAAKHGLLPNYSTIEDLNVGAARGEIGDLVSKVSPFGGKLHNAAADVSEYRDHWVRIAHFIKTLEKDVKNVKVVGNGKNAHLNALDEAAAIASNRVQKWHPNGSDNTRFERNVLRRSILFYSWIRKAIPLVVETAVIHPGRFMAFPKAMYALAESNGIDLNGFSDPFPTDQLFPTWLGGTQGPVMGNNSDGYIGMRMGVPMMDIMDQYFTSPGMAFQTIMGATHPLVKVPFEMNAGVTTQGVPIKDNAKYLLGQVPFGNFVNTMLDKPIGEPSPSDANYDPTGIRDPKVMATINLLSGLGLMDMSKPSMIKSGEFDLKYGRQGG